MEPQKQLIMAQITMPTDVKQRLSLWKQKAGHVTNDHWVRFVIFWMILDAYMLEMSHLNGETGRNEDRLRWFINNDNELKTVLREYWRRPEYLKALETLKSLSPIDDMRPGYRGTRRISLGNIDDDGDLFRFMYQIRCNTIHGGKNLWNDKDNKLTICVEDLLNKPLDVYLGVGT